MLSLQAYAAHRRKGGLPGGSLRTVQKAVGAGRIGVENGKIDPARADAVWLGNTQFLPVRLALPLAPAAAASEFADARWAMDP
jgi:hypothetical protein